MVHPPFDPPTLTVFTQVTQDEIGKIISKSPTKSCLLDPLPTLLIKECIDILLPSITKLVNCSLWEGLVPDGLKKAVVTPLIKKASLPVEDLYLLNSWLTIFIDMAWITNTSQHISQVTQGKRLSFPSKMILICHYLGVKLLPWYFSISRPPLILLIIPLSSAAFWIGSVLVAPLSNGSLPI